MINKKMIILSFLLILILRISNVSAFGLGVAPSEIEIPNALKGQTYERTMGIYNTESYSGIFIINATETGSDWIKFYKEDNPDMPLTNISIPGGKSVELLVKFTIPQDATNGNYSPVIYVNAIPENVTQVNSSSQINIQMPIETLITVVGEQILSGEVKSYIITDTEINHPLRVTIEFQNTGNVIATPLIKTTILKNNLSIDSFNYSQKSFPLNTKDTLEIEWNTTDQNVGDYVANIKVFLGDNLISEKNLSFKILERGVLTVEGRVEGVTAPSEASVGQVVKIEVQFQNTGKLDILAKIKGEVTNSNNEFIDVIEGDETLVKIGEEQNLIIYFKPEKAGDYLIKANVFYEGKKTEINPISIKTTGAQPSGMFIFDTQNLIIILFVIFAFGLILIGIFLKKIRKSTKRK